MKKKYILSALLAASMSGLWSCSEDFLNVESPTALPADEYFINQERIYQNLVAAYDPLEWFDYCNGQYCPINIMSDIMGDQMWPGGSDVNDNAFWHLMMNYSANPLNCMTGLWTDLYTGVKRSNDVLSNIKSVTDITDSNRSLYTAEAKVLRAYYYAMLWKFWGNIPYYSENLKYPYTCEATTADEVYKYIIADIEDAIANGGLPMKASSSDYGRVTLAIAYMLYTEVVMYQNDESRYATALKYMNEIIGSKLYKLNTDLEDLWTKNGEWCSESIWEINYKNEGAARDWGTPWVAGGTVLPKLISPKDWADGTLGVQNGWGFGPVRLETYQMFDEKDKRRDATCLNTTGQTYTRRYQDTQIFLKKYIARDGYTQGQLASPELNFGNNLRIYRYSETLLNAAELLARGVSGEGSAQTYLDEVRLRAGLTSVSASVDNIIDERALEFVGEGKRFWDLIRTGKATTVLVPDTYGYRTNSFTDSKKYLPIPQSEINASQGVLVQNPGY